VHQLVARHGGDPQQWLPKFYEQVLA